MRTVDAEDCMYKVNLEIISVSPGMDAAKPICLSLSGGSQHFLTSLISDV